MSYHAGVDAWLPPHAKGQSDRQRHDTRDSVLEKIDAFFLKQRNP
jgi:hypothetical protein